MKLFGLIVYPLEHSFSLKYFQKKFNQECITDTNYLLFPLKRVNDFTSLLNKHPDISGLNVTLPYKSTIIPYINELDHTIKDIGAVNTIKFIRNNSGKLFLKGFNTDTFGFEKSFKPLVISRSAKALILGTGGSSRAVRYILSRMKLPYLLVSRNPNANQTDYSSITPAMLKEYMIIINTTPVGMYPKVNEYPLIPYEFLTKDHLLFDLVYNPEETLFLKKGREKGAITKNGIEMLNFQAEKSWEVWNA